MEPSEGEGPGEEEQEEREVELFGVPLYVVTCDSLPVRAAPSAAAAIIGERRRGDCLAAAARRGAWLRLAVWRGALEAWASAEAVREEPGAMSSEGHLAVRLEGTQQLVQRQLLRRALGGASASSGSGLCLGSAAGGVEARCRGEPMEWSVHAARAFEPGGLVERCELAPLRAGVTPQQTGKMSSAFSRAIFWQGQGRGRPAKAFLPLGFALLYRAASRGEEPSLSAGWSGDGSALLIRARRRLQPGMELTLPAGLRQALLEETAAEGGGPPQCSRTLEAASPSSPSSKSSATKEASLPGAVRVGQSPIHGRGVFASGGFRRNSLVELCPTVRMAKSDMDFFMDFVMTFEMAHGTFEGQPSDGKIAVAALGSGMMYNHNREPNAKWSFLPSLGGGLVVISAAREISAGEELLIDYGEGYWGGTS